MSNLEKYKKDLSRLVQQGRTMRLGLTHAIYDFSTLLTLVNVKAEDEKHIRDKLDTIFSTSYQGWYTEASAVVHQLIPGRSSEFQELYKGDGKRKGIDVQTYNIQDWLKGVRAGYSVAKGEKAFDDHAATAMRFSVQVGILEAVETRFESSLYDIRQLVQADLFDSELDAGRELLKNGFFRAAGAVAGVVLEKHLGQVACNHSIVTRKQHPTISDFNESLKASNVLDIPTWRGIQRLGDLRNLCDHNKHREPTKDEIQELLDGVDKVTKTIF